MVGGKAAQLAELVRIEGIHVPAGFCVTTDAFQRIMAEALETGTNTSHAPSIKHQLDQLSRLKPHDRDAIRALSAEVRRAIERISIPEEITSAIIGAVARLGEHAAYAVRSSATAEDLPSASFAGQHDTYLNVVGLEAILNHVSRCWASLFTERAVIYRPRNGIDHRHMRMAVVVQRMVFPHAAGILFTADPVSGHRKVTSIDASYGLGEALVSGVVNPDVYKVRGGAVIEKTRGAKKFANRPRGEGGTQNELTDPERHAQFALTEGQILRLETLGRRIEAHFACPQDIEWCLANDEFAIVQSRPITTLFPIPQVADGANHLYLSVGHQQMMTNAFKPLGLSVWQLVTPRPMAEAGGRLFVDATAMLASEASRAGLLEMMGKSDQLTRDAVQAVLDRGDFIDLTPSGIATLAASNAAPAQKLPPQPLEIDPQIVLKLIEKSEASLEKLKRDIQGKSGAELLDFIMEDTLELKRILFDPDSHITFMTAIEATWWLNDQLLSLFGEQTAADALAQSVPNNVTSEMGLALLDVADVIRPYSEVVAFLERVDKRHRASALGTTEFGSLTFGTRPCGTDVSEANQSEQSDAFMETLLLLPGGPEVSDAIERWLEKFGMRGVGEIDITRPRWRERPAMLLPLILLNLNSFEHGAAKRRFDHGLENARKTEQALLERARHMPDGERIADEMKKNIDRIRTFIGYREYPKYGMVSRLFVYKQALLQEAERLVRAGVLRSKADIFWLRFDELQQIVRTREVDSDLMRERRAAFPSYANLKPPRVLTSEGECLNGSYRRDDVPAGALIGLPVSAGIVEGRARVVLDMSNAGLEPGDILVTTFTDPSWTPLFVAIKGLVTEVGGLMTHGAVIAREYGLPAVVGVEDATVRIRDGQRIRVNGSDGLIEMLSS
ncbi:MAG: rifamycin-inactivating phosphotransferase [Gemmatimonadaceae bacterium]